MSDSNYPSPFGPLTNEMLFAISAARTVCCVQCGVARTFEPSPNFGKDLATAGWARSPEVGGDIYRCPSCARFGSVRAAE